MKYLLLSITLLMSSSSIAIASTSYKNSIQNKTIQHGRNFFNHNASVQKVNIRKANYRPMRQQRIEVVERRVRPQQQQFRLNAQNRANHFQQRVNHLQPRRNHAQAIQKRVRPRANFVRPRVDIHTQRRFLAAQKAAQRGHPQAEFDLAMMYAKGNGVQRNPRVAFNLFHRAAKKGHVDAKYCMAVNFDKGYGVIQQKELARHWYGIAAKAGHRGARQRLAQLNQHNQQPNNGLMMNAKYSRR